MCMLRLSKRAVPCSDFSGISSSADELLLHPGMCAQHPPVELHCPLIPRSPTSSGTWSLPLDVPPCALSGIKNSGCLASVATVVMLHRWPQNPGRQRKKQGKVQVPRGAEICALHEINAAASQRAPVPFPQSPFPCCLGSTFPSRLCCCWVVFQTIN